MKCRKPRVSSEAGLTPDDYIHRALAVTLTAGLAGMSTIVVTTKTASHRWRQQTQCRACLPYDRLRQHEPDADIRELDRRRLYRSQANYVRRIGDDS